MAHARHAPSRGVGPSAGAKRCEGGGCLAPKSRRGSSAEELEVAPVGDGKTSNRM
jgi:hypothetical protein